MRRRAAFISRNRFVLATIMGLHISRLFRRGYQSICIEDLWGLREESILSSKSVSREDLSRIHVSCGEPDIVYAPWTSIAGKRFPSKVVGIYTDGGRAILISRGFYVVVLRPMGYGVGNYIVETLDGRVGYIHVGEEGVREARIPSKHVAAYQKIVEAFNTYGSFRFLDAINILVRELGIDRAEARKILEDLVSMGIITISKGMIQPMGGFENI
ncbi:MAG: hypothetical protein QXE01_02710 [Sulfolobales archaeon]